MRRKPPTVALYVSGHGFGHAVRCAELIRRRAARRARGGLRGRGGGGSSDPRAPRLKLPNYTVGDIKGLLLKIVQEKFALFIIGVYFNEI